VDFRLRSILFSRLPFHVRVHRALSVESRSRAPERSCSRIVYLKLFGIRAKGSSGDFALSFAQWLTLVTWELSKHGLKSNVKGNSDL